MTRHNYMPWHTAREIAREITRSHIQPGRQWNLDTINNLLPSGWLVEVEIQDNPTVVDLARHIRNHAVLRYIYVPKRT
jgi:hypothetical protein